MKKGLKTGIVRTVRLEKGYKTRLKRIIKKMGFGGIEYVAEKTETHRDTVSRTANTGRCNKTNKVLYETFIDAEMPLKKNLNNQLKLFERVL